MAFKLRTYKVEHFQDPRIPVDVHDAAWNDPAIAMLAAQDAFSNLRTRYTKDSTATEWLPLATLPFARKRHVLCETRSLEAVSEVGGSRFRGNALGHLEQVFSQGPGTKVTFAVSALRVGVADDGFCFIDGWVGREFGGWGAEAMLVVRFFAGEESKGGLVWQAELNPPKRVRVVAACFSDALAASFDALTRVELSFSGKC